MSVTLKPAAIVSQTRLDTLELVANTATLVRASAHGDNVDFAQSLMLALRAAKDCALALGISDEMIDTTVRRGFYLADIARRA
jgi:hypothetical protein